MMFKKGDVICAKPEYIGENETLKDTIGIVIEYHSENDYLSVGCLHPEKFGIPPILNSAGTFYRLLSKEEMNTLID